MFSQPFRILPDITALMGRCIAVLMLSLGMFVNWGFIDSGPAIAAIRQIEEAPGQIVYQSRHSLTDQTGKRWQAIAFKRIRADGRLHIYLRLVGFPGAGAIDRAQPLTFRSSMGETLTSADASAQIFSDASAPEPNVGQYDLQPLLSQLQAELPWYLSLPMTEGSPLTLPLPPTLIQEWQTLANDS
ncbi:DUF3122 domain-containing protein [Leptolyngbya sp. AN02str]|uniref:DUF3122 domain-containing protein n=1 Tax=Leptolyngbya sp. AN02str TaxID=3423363 RepID=UPI003D31C9A9